MFEWLEEHPRREANVINSMNARGRSGLHRTFWIGEEVPFV